MVDKTVLYYSSNKEDPNFEQKIISDLLSKIGNLPLISVTQKPMDVGQNICVGDVGLSYLNEWRQMLIGAKAATTPYLIMAESDFLYSPEYFSFEPENENAIYRYNNVWMVFKEKFYSFRRKHDSEGAQIVSRNLLIKILEDYLSGLPEWYQGNIHNIPIYKAKRPLYRRVPISYIKGNFACLSFKTGDGVRPRTSLEKGKQNIKARLPYWGRISDVKNTFLSNNIF